MKAKVLYSHTLIDKAIKEEVKKHDFCFVIMYPSEACLIKEVMEIANLSKTLQDDEIVIIPEKNLEGMKELWKKILHIQETSKFANTLASEFTAYKKGKKFTF